MDWSDHGIVLGVRRHGETSVIAELLTAKHGRHLGLVRGGVGRRLRGVLQPGNEVALRWRARLSEHLGSFTIELERARAAALMADPGPLAALTSVCALASLALPERQPHAALFEATRGLLDVLEASAGAPTHWAPAYVHWEVQLLTEIGFGLDLASCAVTGRTTGLAYVSPRTGRAVCAEAAGPYVDRLLVLPAFLWDLRAAPPTPADIQAGLELTGFFLSHHMLAPHDKALPPARLRLSDRIADTSAISCGGRAN